MRRTIVWLCLPMLLLFTAGCGSDALTKEQAQRILAQKYPRTMAMYIYAGDPKYAKQLQDAGLDRDGYVTVKKTKQLGDTTGWLSFTEKAAPYLLETSGTDKKALVQKIKTGEEQLDAVVAVEQNEDGQSVVVRYSTKVITTPFGKLVKLSDSTTKQHTLQMIRSGNDWHIPQQDKP